MGAKADRVFVEGIEVVNKKLPKKEVAPLPARAKLTPMGPSTCLGVPGPYTLEGVTVYTMDNTHTPLKNATIVVTEGSITCLGTCTPPTNANRYGNHNFFSSHFK